GKMGSFKRRAGKTAHFVGKPRCADPPQLDCCLLAPKGYDAYEASPCPTKSTASANSIRKEQAMTKRIRVTEPTFPSLRDTSPALPRVEAAHVQAALGLETFVKQPDRHLAPLNL